VVVVVVQLVLVGEVVEDVDDTAAAVLQTLTSSKAIHIIIGFNVILSLYMKLKEVFELLMMI
jgi:hypothetical protein